MNIGTVALQKLSPMMRQYVETKEQYKDCLLLYRLGDFYELFFEDAEIVSKELELVLTGRDCGLEQRAPMCGVPYHSVDVYISRLIKNGHKVAICEQMEDPALAKGLVQRDVIRVITPGTVIEERMLDEHKNNYIVSICSYKEQIGVAYADVSTGDFFAFELTGELRDRELVNELGRIQPTQIIIDEEFADALPVLHRLRELYYVEKYRQVAYAYRIANDYLLRHFRINSLYSFGCDGLYSAVCSSGALMQYLEETQKNSLTHIHRLQILDRSAFMNLDESTRRNLELTTPLNYNGSRKNTLLGVLDRTETAMGSRKLRSFVDCPLQDPEKIRMRQDAVEELVNNLSLRDKTGEYLNSVYDIERLCSKIAYGTVSAKDCVALRRTLSVIPLLQESFSACSSTALRSIASQLDPLPELTAYLAACICDDPPALMGEGGFIRDGFDPEIDALRDIRHNSRSWLDQFEKQERENTGIKSLKIGFNKVFGYYIEVSKANLSMVPYTYDRKQTLVNAERFITPELKEAEQKILGAGEKLIRLELEIFSEVRERLTELLPILRKNGDLLASADVFRSFAAVAADHHYCRPNINTDGVIRIKNGRHPVIERNLKNDFVPNDVLLDPQDNRLLIITGPNMAGKSTYMRQTALLVLMAHMGSYIPASEADISIVDCIYTRIGASDNLSAGQSTFMVEMNEMANILNNATKNSLLILDEVGRGTSTFDGLSIAWASLEYIQNPQKCGAKALFATHYHELTELDGKLEGVKNFRVLVKEMGEDIIFLRKIVRGSADKSFGIQVARLAGLPKAVLLRAKEILTDLENADINKHIDAELRLFPESLEVSKSDRTDELLEYIRSLEPDALTPKDALDRLYVICSMVK